MIKNIINQELPPGLENESLEVYAHGIELKALFNGIKIDFWQLPDRILNIFRNDLFLKKDAVNIYVSLGIIDENEMLFQHVWCNYGGWNRDPDLTENKLSSEYWDCGNRGKCKYEGVLCLKLQEDEKNPTVQELRIIKLISQGLADKQIADRLNISCNTATTHRQRIERKLNAACKVDVARFAMRNNLPDFINSTPSPAV